MKDIILRDDWYDAETGRYMVIIRSPHGAPHHLSFWCVTAARAALNRLMPREAFESRRRSSRPTDGVLNPPDEAPARPKSSYAKATEDRGSHSRICTGVTNVRRFLLAATFVVAMAPAAFAGHADKDGPFAHANDNQIGTLKTDSDGQITANFTTVLPGGNMPLGMAPNADLAAK